MDKYLFKINNKGTSITPMHVVIKSLFKKRFTLKKDLNYKNMDSAALMILQT